MASLQRFISTFAAEQLMHISCASSTTLPHPNGIGSYPQVFVRKHIVSMTPKSLVKVYENGFPKTMSLSQLHALLNVNDIHSVHADDISCRCSLASSHTSVPTQSRASSPNDSLCSCDDSLRSCDKSQSHSHTSSPAITGTISLHEFIGGGQSFKLFFNIDPQKYIVQNIVRDIKKFLLTSDSVQRILFNGFTMTAEQMVNRTIELRHAGMVRVIFSNVVICWKHYHRLVHEFITDDYSVEPFQEIINADHLLNVTPKERLSVSIANMP